MRIGSMREDVDYRRGSSLHGRNVSCINHHMLYRRVERKVVTSHGLFVVDAVECNSLQREHERKLAADPCVYLRGHCYCTRLHSA